MVGLVVIVAFILLALFAPLIAPYDPIATSWTLVRKPPSLLHWFGTDDLGRDNLARVLYGARASLMAGGDFGRDRTRDRGVPFGLLSGYRGGFIDALISRITDAMLACPFLILAIALAAFLGPSLGNAMIAIGITTTPIFVRLTPRPDHERQGSRTMSRAARANGQSALADRAVSYPAEYHAGAAGAGDAVDRRRHHRRGGAVVPRPRPAAASAVLGQHAERGAAFSSPPRPDGAVAGGSRFSWWCCRSTCSATALRDALDPRER